MALAMYWAVSAGACSEAQDAVYEQKALRKQLRSLCSLFKQGLRLVRRCLAGFARLPQLCEGWINWAW